MSGDDVEAVRRLKEQPGRGISIGGVRPPAALAAAGRIDEYTCFVHPVVAGRYPRLLGRIGEHLEFELDQRWEFNPGATVQRYRHPIA